jgi:hypothetical protein
VAEFLRCRTMELDRLSDDLDEVFHWPAHIRC